MVTWDRPQVATELNAAGWERVSLRDKVITERPSTARGMELTIGSDEARWEVELRNLREELQQLRTEQKEMAQSVRQLVQTFRILAAHLGIAGEPYVPKGNTPSADRDRSGFA